MAVEGVKKLLSEMFSMAGEKLECEKA